MIRKRTGMQGGDKNAKIGIKPKERKGTRIESALSRRKKTATEQNRRAPVTPHQRYTHLKQRGEQCAHTRERLERMKLKENNRLEIQKIENIFFCYIIYSFLLNIIFIIITILNFR